MGKFGFQYSFPPFVWTKIVYKMCTNILEITTSTWIAQKYDLWVYFRGLDTHYLYFWSQLKVRSFTLGETPLSFGGGTQQRKSSDAKELRVLIGIRARIGMFDGRRIL